jgi:hypothetical protein
MNIRNIAILGGIAAALAVAFITAASAKGWPPATTNYMAGLEGAGYTVTIDPASAKHATLSATGTMLRIDKGGKGATLEIIDYNGSRDTLKTDWVAEDGAGPRPRVATSDFAGRVLYWNEDSVLAVDFREPNFREAAQAAGEIFLGRRGTGGPTTGSAPAAGATGTKLPGTGSGPSVAHAGLADLLLPVALLGAGGVLIAACLGGVVRRRRG